MGWVNFLEKTIINNDCYYEKEKSNIENNVLKKEILTSDGKERLHERPYFTFVEAIRSSLSNDLFFIDLTFKNNWLEKSFRTYPESNGALMMVKISKIVWLM